MDGNGVAPVVLALPLEDARVVLARHGWECAGVAVTEPFPRRDGQPRGDGEAFTGEMLVVRQQPAGPAAVRLTVARHPGHPGL